MVVIKEIEETQIDKNEWELKFIRIESDDGKIGIRIKSVDGYVDIFKLSRPFEISDMSGDVDIDVIEKNFFSSDERVNEIKKALDIEVNSQVEIKS